MADLPNKKRIAQLLRMLGSSGGERENAWRTLERAMRSAGVGWSDIGNMIEDGAGDDGKYTESEMLEFAQAAREEGVQAGIKIGEVRASAKGAGNGHLMLPKPAEMAEFCHARLGQLKDDKQRDFVRDMYRITVLRRTLSPKQLAWLSSIYIQIGGKT